ncbi:MULTISPECIES: hypothetical protein [Providencia]|uniref:hypothetical protein n=1 Tax=Providencia TaxID=586 RepID=UPI00234A0A04|nr:hypothetical protein [Providencia sp. PROV149]
MFKDDNHEISAEFSKNQSAGNSANYPLIPALRAGTMVNNQRVNKIQLENKDITHWCKPLLSISVSNTFVLKALAVKLRQKVMKMNTYLIMIYYMNASRLQQHSLF